MAALHGGECSGAYIILIPEHPFNIERICELLQGRRGREIQYSIIVVSEGAKLGGDKEFYKDDKLDEFGHRSWAVFRLILLMKFRRERVSRPATSR